MARLVIPAVLLSTLIGSSRAPAQDDRPGAVVRGEVAARVDSFLSRLEGFDYSGSILIEIHGEVVLRKAYGFADRPRRIRNRPDTAFDIGSMAKQFTAAAVLALQHEGKLEVTDPIVRFLPDAPADKSAITIHQLLSHTAGLRPDFPVSNPSEPDFENVGRDEAVRRILASPLTFRPGSGWEYSNCGYVLLAAIVQRASGTAFPECLRETIFRPAELEHTAFWGDADLSRWSVALGHDAFGTVLHDPGMRPLTWFDLGGGEVVSSLDDLRRWIHALDDGAVLDENDVEQLFVPRTQIATARGRYGYGWFVDQGPGRRSLVQHGGDYLGCGANLQWYRDDAVLIVTSTNVRHDVYPTQNRIQSVVPGLVFGDTAAPAVPAFDVLDAEPGAGLEGSYALTEDARLRIGRVNGRTYLWAEGQAATDLLAPSAESLRGERAWRTQAAQRAFDGCVTGTFEALDRLLGPHPNPSFRPAMVAEIERHGEDRLQRVTVLGSFATGYPHGNPPSNETTLLRLHYGEASSIYAIRWSGREIAWTETVTYPGAAPIPLQHASDGAWVGWQILDLYPVRVRSIAQGESQAIEVSCGGKTAVARRSR